LGDPTGLKNERGKRADWLPHGGDRELEHFIFAFNGWTGGGFSLQIIEPDDAI